VHSHQLPALDREIALAGDAPDVPGYLAASADAFGLTRAAWLDRLANQVRVAAAVADAPRRRALVEEYRNAERATGHGDWLEIISAGASRTADEIARGAEAAGAFLHLLLARLEAAGGAPPADRAEWENQAELAAEALLAADPAFDPADPRFAQRIPWTGEGRELALGWLPRGTAGAPEPEPSLDLPAGAEPGGGDGPPTEGAIAAAAPLRAQAHAALARQELWPEPLVEHHWRALLDALDDARTATEVDLAAAYSDACFAVEADWNVLLVGSLVLPLRAGCTHDPAPATETTRRLTGCGPRELAALPRVRDVVDRIPGEGPQGAFRGEGGFDLLAAARNAGVERPGERLASGPPGTPRAVVLWGAEMALGAAIAPARPRI
jgi:hypothetical protein